MFVSVDYLRNVDVPVRSILLL